MSSNRFYALDQARGLAICAMIFAHFGPGLYERLGITGTALHILEFFGRLATPAFILVFGFTLGIAYMPKARSYPDQVTSTLLRRSAVVLGCVILITLPKTIALLQTTIANGPPELFLFEFLLNHYGVLLFYTFAISISAYAIRCFALAPTISPVFIGSSLILVGTILGFEAWEYGGQRYSELLRLLLASGKYALLVLLGCAWALIPVGVYVREQRYSAYSTGVVLPMIGCSMIFLSLALGRLAGWRSLEDLAHDFDAPPQIWYLSLVGGMLCLAISLFAHLNMAFVSRFLTYTGRAPLKLYVAHTFVLPSVSFIRANAPEMADGLVIAMPLGVFLGFWGSIVWRAHQLEVRYTRN